MSFSGFGKSSGPSIPWTTQRVFETIPEFPWRPPNSNPSNPTASSVIPKVHQEQRQEIPAQTPRPDSSPNKLARERMSPTHYNPLSQNIPEHESQSDDRQPNGTFISSKPAYHVAHKRARSPLISAETPLHSSSALLDSEREIQAKAKRLARFHTEFNQSLQDLHDLPRHKISGNMQNQVPLVQQKADDHADGVTYGGGFPDQEGAESVKSVLGLCPDMCPELERDERERKGDLDKYERMNGDRNQTSKFLAVKKYNRMAEREAELIRPMPVLQKTVDYLLSLLDQPYDDNFLNIYNFLWDRMRAVRMDLRMQHVFNEDAIVMLEQMIRLHVIAMHELCEFKKGEGFTEGFDAHLNIEQMNKTSVELFHLYDDHRKQGKFFSSEKEFREYYALFKLDKHPGYKVEPAELSLDLAKMTPEIRNTPEVLFAREVARACRIGNYIGFFRLARKATFLQACLMHAHFSKLRKQALASLHSGLQNNQGIPVAHVEKWLAMEGENVEVLLEYHGFSIKKYEEAYMVKEGPFLNSDMDFPTRCAQLVQQKRSKRIVDDAKPALVFEQLYVERKCTNDNVDIVDHRNSISTVMHPTAEDELMLDSSIGATSTVLTEPLSLFKERLPVIQNRESVMKMAEISVMMTPSLPPVAEVGDYAQKDNSQQILHHYNETSFNDTTLEVFESKKSQPAINQRSSYCMIYENSTPKKCESEKQENESLLPLFDQKKANKQMLKRILRKWKKQAAVRRENREHKKLLASAALSSLTVGFPIGQIGSQTWSSENLDVDAICRARLEKHGISWLRLNVSDLVAPILVAKNPGARFIYWKLVLLVQLSDPDNQIYHLASDWLFLKLMGASEGHDDELMVSSSSLSIWKKWTDPYGSSPQTCCLSIIRKKVLGDTQKIDEGDVLDSASCLVFLVSEIIPWETQRARLTNFCASIPDGSNLPLLILSIDSSRGEVAERSLDIIRRLGVHDEDKRRICSSSVTFLSDSSHSESLHSFFDDHQLRVGLQWLANSIPSMPLLCLVRTRELVLNYLRQYIAENYKGLDVDPDDCVAGFNEALDKSVEEIMITASTNTTQWPAPEIDLLDKSSNEGILASLCLPRPGWNSPMRIDPLVRAIKSCKLPSFPDTLWLKHGSLIGEQIKQQKLALEKTLVSYLYQSSKLLKPDLASQEVHVMLQKCVGLQLCPSGCCLVPRWILIFNRIYSWQLNKLTVPGISNAYILGREDHLLADDVIPDSCTDRAKHNYASKDFCSSSCLEDYLSLHSFPADVSLDELIELNCCNPFEKQSPVSRTMPLRTIGDVGDGAEANDDDNAGNVEEARMASQNDEDLSCSSSYELVPELMNANRQITAVFKSDRLTTVLERCNRLQDMIDQKLAIYF